ncbi:MAG: HAMP domain-containing sensor histidine kinase [Planctomycetota bacterium]
MSGPAPVHAVAASGVLTTRIGRRLVLLFTGCALLPLLLFAWLVLHAVHQKTHDDLEASLHEGAKTAGMGLAARLSQVAGDLTLAAEWTQRWTASGAGVDRTLDRHVGDRCAAVWLLEGDRVQSLAGDLPVPLSPWDDAELEHLRAGRPIVRVVHAAGALVMARALDTNAPERAQVAATIRAEWLFDPEELRGAGCEVAVYDAEWRPLFSTMRSQPDPAPLRTAVALRSASRTIAWQVDGTEHLARSWHVFLRPQYRLDLLVVQSRPAHEALAVGESFARTFVLTALCTLLLVLFASLRQMQRTIDPIVRLRDATHRVAGGDLEARVELRNRDEFGELGAAFDHMTEQLRESRQQREHAERALVASRDAALAAAQAKAEFVTNVSHEFRTPMTEILGAAEILAQREGVDDAARTEFAAIAHRGALRLAALVDDVLELGSTATWPLEPVDVAETLRRAVDGLPLPQRARLDLSIAEGLPIVLGCAGRLVEVWGRLIDNATKFSPPDRGVALRATARTGEVVVEIEDHGPGIAEADRERIFEPFCQVGRDQMTDKANGTGLGLTLARSIVERHQGRIELDSELGRGSVFRVVLPALQGTSSPAATTCAASS